VALTFDDGPDNVLTARVLDKLDKYNVKATFMVVGQRVNDSTAAIIRRMVNSGHEIGNHSWSYSGMANMSPDQIRKSIADTNAVIQNMLEQHQVLPSAEPRNKPNIIQQC